MLPTHQVDSCLVRHPFTDTPPPRVLHLKLTPEILQQLNDSNGKDISIDFEAGKGLVIAGTNHSFNSVIESTIFEVYRASRDSSRSIEMAGNVTHKITVRRELGTSISEKLKSRQAEELAAKQERSIVALDIDHKSKPGRTKPTILNKSAVTNTLSTSSPARKSAFLQSRKSPLLIASSPKAAAATPRTRLLQTLAIASYTEAELESRMRVSSDLLQNLLNDIGKRTDDGWVLDDALYKHVKIWDWKHYTSAERSTVISRAAEAFDRLGLAAKDPVRTLLTHPEKRHKAERFDTSPLSLVMPQTADRSHQSDTRNTSELPIVVQSPPASRHNSVTCTNKVELPPERKRNGLLSSGKKSSASISQKRKADGPLGHEEQPPKKLAISKVTAIKESVSSPANNTRQQSDEETGSSCSPSQSTGVSKKVRRLTPGSNSMRGAKGNVSASERSQTPSATAAMVAPSCVREECHVEELHSVDRTSSLTSSSSDRSTDSRFTTSTAPSSIAEEELPQSKAPLRSKFLIAKKFDAKMLSRPVSNISSPIQSITQHGHQMVTGHRKSASLFDEKRDIDNLDPPHVLQKRHQTIDLCEMARTYKKLYPEYRKLHDEVLENVENDDLRSKYLKLHRQMSKWKTTLFEEDSKH